MYPEKIEAIGGGVQDLSFGNETWSSGNQTNQKITSMFSTAIRKITYSNTCSLPCSPTTKNSALHPSTKQRAMILSTAIRKTLTPNPWSLLSHHRKKNQHFFDQTAIRESLTTNKGWIS